MLRNLLAVIPVVVGAMACTILRDHSGEPGDGLDVDSVLLEVNRPAAGLFGHPGSGRILAQLSGPAAEWYRAQFGPRGITPYVPPALLPDDNGVRGDPEHALAAWLSDPEVRTFVVVGQDDHGGEGLVANFAYRLATAVFNGGETPVPLLIEMCQLLGPNERGRPVSRVELAGRAIEQQTGWRPDARAIEADLEARALILVVTDFDRLAEWSGPRGALSAFQGIRDGPGKLLMRARPAWFQASQRDELELLGTQEEAPGGSTGAEPEEVADTAWLVLAPLSQNDLASAVQRLRPGDPRSIRAFDRYPVLVAPARQAALTPIILDILDDPLLLEDVLAAPHRFRIYETWTRWALEQRLGEGRVSLVEAAERALTHLAGRIYETGRLRLQPTGQREKALLETTFAEPLCAPDAFLDCGDFGYAFRQGRWLDYFAARYLRDRIVAGNGVDAGRLHRALATRRPVVGTMALLAAALDAYPNTDRALREALALEAVAHCGRAGSRTLPTPAHATEAILRLRYLREGIVHPDGSLPENPEDLIAPLVADYKRVQDFWRQVLAEEERGLRREARTRLGAFLATPDGQGYVPTSRDSVILRSRDGTDWSFVPPGCGIIGSYFSPDEAPVRWVRFNRPFLLATKPVTNNSFKPFVDSGVYPPHPPWLSARWARYLAGWTPGHGESPTTFPEGHRDYPVTHVSWLDTQAFVSWRSRRDGKATSLPSADEWEYAARGTLGRLYPWGDLFDAGRCNSAEGARWQVSPAGSFAGSGAGPFGNLDMAGNVWEWTSSRFRTPGLDDTSDARTLVGGGWRSTGPEVRSSRRLRGVSMGRYDVVGFRVKRDIPTP